jgi:PIN domain nuclease of toxin-antitoxin system
LNAVQNLRKKTTNCPVVVLRVGRLPEHHKDPFDRIIVAQALLERMTIITFDKQIGRYGARILWQS